MVEDAWTLSTEAEDQQCTIDRASVGMPYVFQLPGSPFLNIHLQTQDAVSFEHSFTLIYHTYDIDYVTMYIYS